jgi:DNA-binding XRE family transcriptional regulator
VRQSNSQEDIGLEIPLGRNIRRLRMERNMTQRELAWHLKISVQAVSKWERGCTYPDLSLLLPIARLFSVTLDELFGRNEDA